MVAKRLVSDRVTSFRRSGVEVVSSTNDVCGSHVSTRRFVHEQLYCLDCVHITPPQGAPQSWLLPAREKGEVFRCAYPASNNDELLYRVANGFICCILQRLQAACSGMDCAVMSGGDVGPLGKDAVTELHGLFRWAAKSPRFASFVTASDMESTCVLLDR